VISLERKRGITISGQRQAWASHARRLLSAGGGGKRGFRETIRYGGELDGTWETKRGIIKDRHYYTTRSLKKGLGG